MIQNLREIPKEELISEVQKLREHNARLVVMTCVDLSDRFEVTYFFTLSPSTEMTVLRTVVPENEALPSITGIYLTALLNENEFKEFYGLKIDGLAVDYNGHLFLAKESPVTPMRKPVKEAK